MRAKYVPPPHAQAGRTERTERRTFAGAAHRGPKPSDGLAAEERGGSRTRNLGAGGARHEAEDMGGVGWSRRHDPTADGSGPGCACLQPLDPSALFPLRRRGFARRRGETQPG